MVILCIGLIIWNKAHKPVTVVSPEEEEKPWERALRELDALQEKQLIENGYLKEYYSLLSGIIRTYLEKRFLISAPEMTTEEFLQFAQRSSELTSDQRLKLHEFLQSCDLVKFARFKPGVDETHKAHENACAFIQETRQ